MKNPSNKSKSIAQVQHCATMTEVRRCVDALDDILVPLLVQRTAYMTQAARIKQDVNLVRDEARIQAIVDRVRAHAVAEGGEPAVIEALYRGMMEIFIGYEHHEFARLREGGTSASLNGGAVHNVTSLEAVSP
jgi:isochorismate pyruvate lyase